MPPTAIDAARAMLVAATIFTGETTPGGCLLASATASGSSASADVQRAVADIRGAIGERLPVRIEGDMTAGLADDQIDELEEPADLQLTGAILELL